MNFLRKHKWVLVFSLICLILTPLVFELADKERGYDSIGGEMFFPFFIE